ncbi:hypothetical protein GR197_24135 [Rhizobium phaseoli]|uniref:Uncharacterized protein n=1 Tax=Rhizobium phaseoli TaxID=396 RepID=A0A7K3UJC5_9HYPH|nr:hypothetical protein [Rhizobium phaseoli]NEJ73591.1 hypothetical protein [Rhizobium phaseoli]
MIRQGDCRRVRFQRRFSRLAEVISAKLLSPPFGSARRYLFGAAFYSRSQEDNWRASNFLELASALFHGNAETKLSALHRTMIIRVVTSINAALYHSQVQAGSWGPDNCFDIAGMDLRDMQSEKVA